MKHEKKNSAAFIDYSQKSMLFMKIQKTKKSKILIVFDDMIVDMDASKNKVLQSLN